MPKPTSSVTITRTDLAFLWGIVRGLNDRLKSLGTLHGESRAELHRATSAIVAELIPLLAGDFRADVEVTSAYVRKLARGFARVRAALQSAGVIAEPDRRALVGRADRAAAVLGDLLQAKLPFGEG